MEQIVIIKPDKQTVPLQTKGSVTKITKAEQRVKLLSEDLVQISVESPYPQHYEIGDKIVVFGREYTMNTLPKAKKKGANSFGYDLTFEGVQYSLARAQYELSLETTGIEVEGDSLMGNFKLFMQVLVKNANRIFPGKFALGVCPDTDTRNLVFNCENCLAVLQRLCGEFEQEFDIVQNNDIYTINIKKAGTTFPYTFEYGKGRGMYELTRQNVSSSNIVTRLKVFGSEQNIGPKYRSNRVCLPGKTKSKSFLEDTEAIAKYGVWEDTKIFDKIYPKRTGVVTAKGDTTFKFVDKTMFDLNAKDGNGTLYLIDGVAAKVHVNTGGLQGYEFDVHAYDHATKTFILKRFTDDRGMVFPSESSPAFQFKPGDEYVLLDINLPQSYYDEAEAKLKEEGEKYLPQNSQPKVQYGLNIEQGFLRQFVGEGTVGNIFMVGDYIPVKDEDLKVDKSIRIVGFNRDLLNEYNYSLTIADTVEKNIYNRIISDLVDIDRIIEINDLANPSKARRKWLSSQELLGMIFDPEGDYYSEKIKPGSIETMMLSVGAKSMQLMLQNTMLEANYNGNKNSIRVTGGVLTHYTIEDAIRNWNLSTATTTLTGDANSFYIYAKCLRTGTSGTIIFSTTQIRVDQDPNYYHFWIGAVHSVIDNVRAITLTYGSTTINGKFISTGRIQSSGGGKTYFDVDKGEIGGNIKFTASDGTSKSVSEVDEMALEVEKAVNEKRRVFTTTPSPPYDIGDLWVNGTDLKRCKTARKTGESYNASDWVLAVDYDNTKTVIDGGLVTSGTVQLVNGNSKSIVAGITGGENEAANAAENMKVRIWSGSSKEDRFNAPFRVMQDGSFVASKARITGESVFEGSLKGVSGSFNSLNCVNSSGQVVGSISFGSDGNIWFQGGLFHQASQKPFYTSDVFCRGTFGAYTRNTLVVHGSYAYYYTKGLPTPSNKVYISLSSETSQQGHLYYNIPLYGGSGDAAGMPIDIVIFNVSGTYRYQMQRIPGKKVLLINGNDQNNEIYIYSNGNAIQFHGGVMGEWVNIDGFMSPAPGSNLLGRGWLVGPTRDNNWS